jgi:hypothetical protein
LISVTVLFGLGIIVYGKVSSQLIQLDKEQSWNRTLGVSTKPLLSSSQENFHLTQMEEVLHQARSGSASGVV